MNRKRLVDLSPAEKTGVLANVTPVSDGASGALPVALLIAIPAFLVGLFVGIAVGAS